MDDYKNEVELENVEETAVEPIEPITMDEVKAKKAAKRRDMTIGGIGFLSGLLAAWIYVKKVHPAVKEAHEANIAKRAAKIAKKAEYEVEETEAPEESEG